MVSRCGGWTPVLVMLAVVVAFAMMNAVIKMAIDEGMDRLVLITLRQLVATLFMAPIAYFRERKTRPKLSSGLLLHLFFSALLGAALPQYLFFIGLQYTSATFACAFLNMAPVMTFLIALPFGLENLNVKSKAGCAKVVGTVVCLVGVMLMTLYRGAALTSAFHGSTTPNKQNQPVAGHDTEQWVLGSIALLAGSLSWSSWFVLQSKISKKYPAIYSCTSLVFFLSFIQAGVLRLATQRDFSPWAVRRKVEIITVVLSGMLGSAFGFLAMSWCVEKKGPVFTAAFTPLIQIMVAVIDFSILHEPLYLGCVVGSVFVVAGLYLLLWGKCKEGQISVVKHVQGNDESQGLPQQAV